MATVYCIRRGVLGKQLVPMDVEDAARACAAGLIRAIGHNLFTEEMATGFLRESPNRDTPQGFLREAPATSDDGAYQTADMQPQRRKRGRPAKGRP